ncbi:MAG: M48 family metalloprotease [Defluviitaleaceae bacterium]|nr:M48 family metalloprotease [Defluviitaleaceae bacterium]
MIDERVRRILIYFLWLMFYIFLFGYVTFFLIIPFYIIAFIISFSPLTEKVWRFISGVRPLRLSQEKERLLPIFTEVYEKALRQDEYLPENINLYIQESMDINAFAFGRTTLVLTKGSIVLLSDDNLKGLIAHELGHFANRDTMFALFTSVTNLPLSIILRLLNVARTKMEETSKTSFFVKLVKSFLDLIYFQFKYLELIGDLIIMHDRRKGEYVADIYAFWLGYGAELAEALIEIYQISTEKRQSVKEMVRATHPAITKRIERLENRLDR